MAAYDLFGITSNKRDDERKFAEEICVAKFLVEYRYGKNTTFQIRNRLTQILQTTEWWDRIGCILCFTATGAVEPDHKYSSCHRKEQASQVDRTVRWLNTLNIPKDSTPGGRGFCSFCWHFHPCTYTATGNGICNRRAIIQQVIAVLSSLQNYKLGHVSAELASHVDLSTEEGTHAWLQERVPFKDPHNKASWFPNLLLLYETLVVSFYYQQNIARGVDPLLGFPDHPAGQTNPSTDRLLLMDDRKESEDWATAVAWWEGKCGFCAGRYLKGPQIEHCLEDCKRGGKEAIEGDFGEAIYEDGILPLNGCDQCYLPFSICGSWRLEDGEWIRERKKLQCKYGPSLLRDTIVGLVGSENSSLRDKIHEAIEEYCIDEDTSVSFDGETVAEALSCAVTSDDKVVGSRMIKALWYMTEEIWATNGGQEDVSLTENGESDKHVGNRKRRRSSDQVELSPVASAPTGQRQRQPRLWLQSD